jgi:hypothetical protein
MRAPSQRSALGALFLCLAVAFGGIAAAAAASESAGATRFVIAVAAGAIGLWLLGLALRSLRSR